MTLRSSKISTVAAALVIAFFSIYAATVTTFSSTNNTQNAMTVTLQMQSGINQDVNLAPGQTAPTNLNGDAVTGAFVYGAFVPGGQNAIVPNPTGGTVKVSWMIMKNADGSTNVAAVVIDPNVVS
jgi:hypothetical protein